nr:putative retrotransposon Ty1-copia subclass protein [Tanacetum cinerariifolium]
MKVEDDEVGDLGEPANYKSVMLDLDKVIWQGAMDEEMKFMKVNKVWIVVDRPPNANVVRNKWPYKKKTDMDGKVHTYKARLVAKGCTQTFGIGYQETFSPIADIRAIRILIAITAAKVKTIEESKDLTSLSLDELIRNLKVHEMIIKKDSKIVEEEVERKCLALMAKKESSDEECLTSRSKDEEYAMAARDFKKFFKRRECPKPPKDKNQRAFIEGSWSDSGEEDDEKVKNKTCLVAQPSSDVSSESSYFSDDNSSIDDLALDNEYDKLCKMSLKIITKNKRLKVTRISLENKLRELKDKLSTLEKNKGVNLECVKCHMLKIKNERLKEESIRLNKFENSTHCLNKMFSGDKLGLGFNLFEASSSGTKKIKFMKAQKKASSDRGPINMGGP